MPRYFFHLRDGSGTLLHIEGSEHADDEAAAAEAMRQVHTLIAEHRAPLGDRIEVDNAAGARIATIGFADPTAIEWG